MIENIINNPGELKQKYGITEDDLLKFRFAKNNYRIQ